ncbi:hypothetical protein LJC74_09810 [Eubacteriales bacterium OttesenSCG-928-A19]|nr:hypothetical protein [Eubacteriales bacterium OttesenSCG-928-A19]
MKVGVAGRLCAWGAVMAGMLLFACVGIPARAEGLDASMPVEAAALVEIAPAMPAREEALVTLSFLDGDGLALFAETVAVGTASWLPEIEAPPVEGYVFLHWADEAGEAYAFGQPLHADLTLTPAYEAVQWIEALADQSGGAQAVEDDALGFEADTPAEWLEMPVPEAWTEMPVPEVSDAALSLLPPVLLPEGAQLIPVEALESSANDILLAPEGGGVEQAATRGIDIAVESAGELTLGSVVTLRAQLCGYESLPVAMRWQYEAAGEWFDVAAGGDGPSYTFVLDAQNAAYRWRLRVTLL